MIVPATVFHAGALAAIHHAAFPPGEAWSEAALAAQLQARGVHGLVAEEGAFLLARTILDEAELLTLAVHPDLRRRGLATTLLHQALTEAATRGATRMLLEVAETNAPARALYAIAGFELVGRRRAYYPGAVDALMLQWSEKSDDGFPADHRSLATGH